jgi:hypothetical protein
VDDNIRCKLLLGLAVSVASCSKPMVAFTKSRKISRAVSGSPLRKYGLDAMVKTGLPYSCRSSIPAYAAILTF